MQLKLLILVNTKICQTSVCIYAKLQISMLNNILLYTEIFQS